MSRKAASDITRVEDALIADTLMVIPLGAKYARFIATRVSALLTGRGVGTARAVEKFVEGLLDALAVHTALLLSENHDRASLRRKYTRLARALEASAEGIVSLTDQEYGLLQRFSRLGAEGLSEKKPLEVEQNELFLMLSFIIGSARNIALGFTGTKQDRTRPYRYLVYELMRVWLKAGLPRPTLVRDADPDDIMCPEPDPFSEMVSLVTDDHRKDERPTPAAIRHLVRAALDEFAPKIK